MGYLLRLLLDLSSYARLRRLSRVWRSASMPFSVVFGYEHSRGLRILRGLKLCASLAQSYMLLIIAMSTACAVLLMAHTASTPSRPGQAQALQQMVLWCGRAAWMRRISRQARFNRDRTYYVLPHRLRG